MPLVSMLANLFSAYSDTYLSMTTAGVLAAMLGYRPRSARTDQSREICSHWLR